MKIQIRTGQALALALTLGVVGASAPAARADKAGMDLLKKVVQRYRSLTTYSDSWERTERLGKRMEKANGDVRVAKPNKFYLTIAQKGQLITAVAANGKTATAYLGLRKEYVQQPAPAKLPETYQNADHQPLTLIAGMDPLTRIEDATITGRTTVNGIAVQILSIKSRIPEAPKDAKLSDAARAQLAEIKKNPPKIRYFIGVADSLVYRNDFETTLPPKDGKRETYTIQQDFRNVRVNQPIPDQAFAFTPPKGSKNVTPASKKPG